MTAASRPPRAFRPGRAALALLICLPLGASKARLEPGPPAPVTPHAIRGNPSTFRAGGGPVVRVGVALDRPSITLSSPGGLKLEDVLTGQPAGEVEPGGTLLASADGSALLLEGDLSDTPTGVPSVRVRPARTDAAVFVAGRPYRGSAELRVADDGRVSAINVLPLEDYLLGVVPLEIGPREPDELAAVEAQAVAARTYAVAQLGGQLAQGFDLFGTVDDQAYGGMAAERDESTIVAVDSTFATPVNFRPASYGIDIVVHSATKYLAGHNDVLGGVVAGKAGLVSLVRDLRSVFGAMLDPHAAWLLLRYNPWAKSVYDRLCSRQKTRKKKAAIALRGTFGQHCLEAIPELVDAASAVASASSSSARVLFRMPSLTRQEARDSWASACSSSAC